MSQKKTVVPGMESGYTPQNATNDFYSRSSAMPNKRGTMIPDMNYTATQENPNSVNGRTPINAGKPVAGFLYSVSRQGIGEYWPLYIGPNTIGSSPDCDIVLREGTVSSEHATIVVRKMRNPEKTVASINDARSTNGTMLNGESLWMDAKECFNGDIITVGMNYEMVIILIDSAAMGLRVSKNFIPMDEQEASAAPESFSPSSTRAGLPYFDLDEEDMYNNRENNNGIGGGTVGFDNRGFNSGGTVGM